MNKVIAIIGAMDEEIELFFKEMQEIKETYKAGITFYTGVLFNQHVVLCKSGVGKVNAAICTQILIDQFKVDYVIFTGVAGGVDPSLNIGDLVISTECQQHDLDASILGFPRGHIPFAEHSIFPADERLISYAVESGKRLNDVQVVCGKVISGDQFIANKEQVKALYEEFHAACVEMEGAAVAQVCFLNQIPFVIIRSLSDKADQSAPVNFQEFTKLAAKRSYLIVQGMLALI